MSLNRRELLLAGSALVLSAVPTQIAGRPLRLAVAGLVHGHARSFLDSVRGHKDVELAGVSEGAADVLARYAERFAIPAENCFRDTAEMIEKARPDAVAAFCNTYDHPAVVEACAAQRLPVMMEKPLAVSREHAERIRHAAAGSGIPVIVNYETTWYRSHRHLWTLVRENQAVGGIRKMVAMSGHQGPREVGASNEFFDWLTDPVRNGAGALFDFGCYGANLMTWLMDNQRPQAVTARTFTVQPHIYSKVDDEATVLLDYPQAQGIIQASWNWPFGRKDFEVYGATGYAHAIGGNTLKVRRAGERSETTPRLPELPVHQRDAVSYLVAVSRGHVRVSGLSALENNLIATDILVAARESAATGKTVSLS